MAWTTLPPLPDEAAAYVDYDQLVACNGKLYWIPYYLNDFDYRTDEMSTVWIYDIAGAAWSKSPADLTGLAETIVGMAAAAVGETIWMVSIYYPNQLMSYNTTNDTFTDYGSIAPAFWHSRGMSSASIGPDGWLYTVGRQSNFQHYAQALVIDVANAAYGATPTRLSAVADFDYNYGGFAIVGSKLYVAGGYDPNNAVLIAAGAMSPGDYDVGGMRILDVVSDTWSIGSTVDPHLREENCCVAAGGRIYSIGGGDDASNDSYCVPWVSSYDISTGQWTVEEDLPIAVAGTEAAFFDGQLYVLGGYPESGPDVRALVSMAVSGVDSGGGGPAVQPRALVVRDVRFVSNA